MELSEGNNIGQICRIFWYFRFRICFRVRRVSKRDMESMVPLRARKDLDENKPVRSTSRGYKVILIWLCTSACYRPFTVGWRGSNVGS